jgi:S1-C subfamily serine protease
MGSLPVNLSQFNEEVVKVVSQVSRSVVTVFSRQVSVDEFLLPQTREGMGSAFAVEDGLFITSYHVVRGSSAIRLLSREGEDAKGEVAAVNPFNDLAMIRSSLNLPPLKLAEGVRLGEIALAVGNPLGLDSVTMGVVSGLGRTILSPGGNPLYVIQTDAAVNPGNSGGPLVNVNGEVLGVVTAMIPFAQGIGFAIPAQLIRGFLNNVRKFGKYLRPFLGVVIMKVNKPLASYYNLPTDEGLLVIRTYAGSPASKVGIRPGDVIQEVDGRKVTDPLELHVILEEKGPGETVNLRVIRPSKRADLRVEIGGYEVVESMYYQ